MATANPRRSRRPNRRAARTITGRNSQQPKVQPLEERVLLSDARNAFAHLDGELRPFGGPVTSEFYVTGSDFTLPRGRVLLGLAVHGDGATQPPAITRVLRINRGSAPAYQLPGLGNGRDVMLAGVGRGAYSLVVSPGRGGPVAYRADVYLVGDANGDARVTRDDLQLIRSLRGRRQGDAGYRIEADVNRDGRIGDRDLVLARLNLGVSTRIRPLSVTAGLDPSSDPDGDGKVAQRDVSIVGLTRPGAIVRLGRTVGGPFDQVTTAGNDGSYRLGLSADLGANPLRIEVVDSFGQRSVARLTFERTETTGPADTVPPTAAISLSGTLTTAPAEFTVSYSEPVSGAAFQSASYTLTRGGAAVALGSVVQTSPTSARIVLPVPLSDGDYTLEISPAVADLAGNPLAAGARSFAFQVDTAVPDKVAPTAAINLSGTVTTAPTGLAVVYNEAVAGAAFQAASYSLSRAGTVITLGSVDRVDAVTARVTFTEPLVDGDYTFQISPAVADLAGNPLAAASRSFTFSVLTPAQVTSVSPANGEEMVSLTRETVVRFDDRIDPATLNSESFYVIALGQRVPGRIVVSPTEQMAIFFYDQPLTPSTEVRVVVDGDQIRGRDGLHVDADRDGLPGGMATADFTTLPLTFIPGTRVWGRVFDSYNRNPDGSNIPVVGARISLDADPSVFAVTDATGYFELGLQDRNGDGVPDGLPAPEFFVHIDGSAAINAPEGTAYATLGKPFHSVPGQRVQLEMDGNPFDVYLPPMAMSDIVPLDPNADTVVGFGPAGLAQLQALFPNLDPVVFARMQVTYPAGSAQDAQGNPATRATVIPVAPDRLPAPLPPNVDPQLVISIQAGNASGFNLAGGPSNFLTPAPVTFPNLEGLAPGEKALIWSFDHDAGKWIVIGTGTVSSDALTISSDPGVGILAPGWHFVIQGSPGRFLVGMQEEAGNPLAGGPDFDMTDELFVRIDTAFDDALGGFADLLSIVPGLGGLSDLIRAPIETTLRSLIRDCYTLGARVTGADLGIVTRYYEKFLSGVGGRYDGEADVLELIGRDPQFKSNVRLYKPTVEQAVQAAIEANIDPENGVLDLDKVRDTLVQTLNVTIDSPVLNANSTLKLIIDNTQKATLEVTSLQADGEITDPTVGGTGHWTANLIYTVSDDFGFDPEDISRTYEASFQQLRDALRELVTANTHTEESKRAAQSGDLARSLSEGALAAASLRRAASSAKDAAENFFGASCVKLFRIEQEHGRARPFITDFPVDHTDNPDDMRLSGDFRIPPGFDDVIVISGSGSRRLAALDITPQTGSTQPTLRVSTASGFGSSKNVYYRINVDSGVELSGILHEGESLNDVILPPRSTFTATFYAPRYNLSLRLSGKASESGIPTFIAKSPFDTGEKLGTLRLDTFGGLDSDGDLIPDIGEYAIGTDPDNTDSDGDGISDSAEIEQGLNPLDNRGFPTGVIANLALPGPAEAVDVVGDFIYVATGSHGLAIVNGSRFNNPILQGQIDLPGNAMGVGVDPALNVAAVAAGSTLELVDVSDPMVPRSRQSVGIGATRVVVRNGLAFATSGTFLRVVDLLTGNVVQTVFLPGSGETTGLAREGSTLYAYVSGSDTLGAVDISNEADARVLGQIGVSIASSDVGLFVGNGVAWLSGSGLTTVDVSNPASLRVISGADSFFNARRFALNGSGLGVLAPDGGNFVQIYDTSNPQNTASLLTQFPLTGSARSVGISRGLAYVGTGNRLEVVNYRPFDTLRQPPTVGITTSAPDVDPDTPGVQALEGSAIPVRVTVTDDVQVRMVELLVNGQVVATDVAFPFDFVTVAPRLSSGVTELSIQVRATDTGGNSSLSNVLTLGLSPDRTPPTIVGIDPPDGSTRFRGQRTVRVRFSEPLDAATVTSGRFALFEAGPNGVIGDSDDVAVPAQFQLRDDDRLVQLTTDPLAAGLYQLRMTGDGITDRAGNALTAGVVTSIFNVVEFEASPEFLPFGTDIFIHQDDVSVAVAAMPFEFEFFGQLVSGPMYVTSNGVVEFNQDTIRGNFTNSALPRGNVVAAFPFWDDLDPRYGGRIGLFDGDGVRAITWEDLPYYSNTSRHASFQIAFLANGVIQVRYGAIDPMADGSATIGLQRGNTVAVPGPGRIANKADTQITGPAGLLNATGLATLNELPGNDLLIFTPDGSGGYIITHNPSLRGSASLSSRVAGESMDLQSLDMVLASEEFLEEILGSPKP